MSARKDDTHKSRSVNKNSHGGLPTNEKPPDSGGMMVQIVVVEARPSLLTVRPSPPQSDEAPQLGLGGSALGPLSLGVCGGELPMASNYGKWVKGVGKTKKAFSPSPFWLKTDYSLNFQISFCPSLLPGAGRNTAKCKIAGNRDTRR